ncbi:type II toxin-antitoxin system VapC family toxin [Peterkaempfera bronchialis]|uniref:type II toxin-antitoxin system VapC family toxin n=1 Tax=Peterkaempfera bronchialis TaxID=2126346 RepID=UPI003C2DEF33
MLIVDTGPLVALLNRNDPDHQRCAELLESHDGELLITPYVLTEACYLVAKYVGPDAEINLVEAVAGGDLAQVEMDQEDLARMSELMRQYRGFPLGITDASVIALAEHGKATSVATLDHRHFRAVTPRHVPALTLLP